MNPDYVYLVSGALFTVWMQRHRRWRYFWWGLTGQLVIKGTRGVSQGGVGIPALVPPGESPGTTPELPGVSSSSGGTPELPSGGGGEDSGGVGELGAGAELL